MALSKGADSCILVTLPLQPLSLSLDRRSVSLSLSLPLTFLLKLTFTQATAVNRHGVVEFRASVVLSGIRATNSMTACIR